MHRNFVNVKFVSCLLLLTFAVTTLAQDAPPQARIDNVVDDYFGTKIVDSYRWMEDQKSDEMQRWMKAQADYADAYLRKLPLRAGILKRLEELTAKRNFVGGVRRFGDRLLYRRLAAGENIGKYVVRAVAGGAETTVLDLEKMSLADKKNYGVRGMLVSPDGKLLAYSIFSGGSEDGEIRVLEIATGKDLGVRIGDDAQPQAWLPDSKSFLYQRLEEQSADAKPEQREERKRVRLHTLGTNQKNDREIFGYAVNREIEFSPSSNNYAVTVPTGSRYAFGWVNTVSTNHELYFAPVAELSIGAPVKWRKIAGLEDQVFASDYREYQIGVRGDELYLATTKDAPRGKIIRLDLKNPGLARAETIFPESAETVFNLRAAKDAMYVQTLDSGASKLYRVDYKSHKRQPIEIPANGSAWALSADAERDGLIFGTDSWVQFPNFLNFNPRTNKLEKMVFASVDKVAAPDIEVVSAKARSHDGTLVPMVIIHKKGLRLDSRNPTLMHGYGAYGTNRLEPMFFAS